MRMRKKSWTKPFLEKEKEYFINEILNINFNWEKKFNNENKKIQLEIGTGKGNFIIKNAIKNKDINFIGIELFLPVIAISIKKIKNLNLKEGIKNLKFINYNANQLNTIFKKESIDLIYLNFSDPWPKKRHEKRRLTSNKFLNIYKYLLKKDGFIKMKTDNFILFNYSLKSFENNNWKIIEKSNDLYNSKYLKNNIATEYENKFHKLNKPIYYLKTKYKN